MARQLNTVEFLTDHFREQQERMEISDEDWDEYEERMRWQDEKRKRTRGSELSASSGSDQAGDVGQECDPPSKKRKLSQRVSRSPSTDPIRSPSPFDQLPPPESQGRFPDISISSNMHRTAVRASSSKPPKPSQATPASPLIASTSMSSSNITSPETTPLKASPQISAPPGPRESNDNSRAKVRESRKSKSVQSTAERGATRKRSTEDRQRAQEDRLAKRETEKLKAAREEKEATMTPLEYAAILQEKWKARLENTPKEKLFLKDKVIFLIFEERNRAHKDTRAKLDIIAKNGGKVAPQYDPNVVTHIIPASTFITLKKTLRVLGLKSLSEIPPNVKTVKWGWVASGLSKRKPDSEIMHELFKQRIAFMYPTRGGSKDATSKEKEKSWTTTTEHSVIEQFNSAYDSPNEEDEPIVQTVPRRDNLGSPKSTSMHLKVKVEESEDPLLPFYAKAREEAEAESDEEGVSKQESNANIGEQNHKGFQCDKKGARLKGASPNWDVIEKLAELRELHRENGTKDDMWRVIGYQKAIGSLKLYPTRIKSREEAVKLGGISDKTADKIMEIIRTGELRRIQYTKTEDLDTIRIFNGIYGVGSNTARKWYNEGFRTLVDLKKAVKEGTHKMSAAQEIGLRFYDDINDRMPRAEAQEIFEKIKPIALSIDPKLSMEIMGSFRRGKETCGDIDILLTRPTDDGCTHAGILPKLCNLLHNKGILTDDLATPDEWGALEATYRGLCRRDLDSRRRRIDILCVPYQSRGAARIYYTGDDIFNRSIRLKANKMEMSLNQRGLFEGVVRDPQDRRKKLCPGSLLCSHSERKIFEILGVPWQEPHERVRSG